MPVRRQRGHGLTKRHYLNLARLFHVRLGRCQFHLLDHRKSRPTANSPRFAYAGSNTVGASASQYVRVPPLHPLHPTRGPAKTWTEGTCRARAQRDFREKPPLHSHAITFFPIRKRGSSLEGQLTGRMLDGETPPPRTLRHAGGGTGPSRAVPQACSGRGYLRTLGATVGQCQGAPMEGTDHRSLVDYD
jgi:hypothetical protein